MTPSIDPDNPKNLRIMTNSDEVAIAIETLRRHGVGNFTREGLSNIGDHFAMYGREIDVVKAQYDTALSKAKVMTDRARAEQDAKDLAYRQLGVIGIALKDKTTPRYDESDPAWTEALQNVYRLSDDFDKLREEAQASADRLHNVDVLLSGHPQSLPPPNSSGWWPALPKILDIIYARRDAEAAVKKEIDQRELFSTSMGLIQAALSGEDPDTAYAERVNNRPKGWYTSRPLDMAQERMAEVRALTSRVAELIQYKKKYEFAELEMESCREVAAKKVIEMQTEVVAANNRIKEVEKQSRSWEGKFRQVDLEAGQLEAANVALLRRAEKAAAECDDLRRQLAKAKPADISEAEMSSMPDRLKLASKSVFDQDGHMWWMVAEKGTEYVRADVHAAEQPALSVEGRMSDQDFGTHHKLAEESYHKEIAAEARRARASESALLAQDLEGKLTICRDALAAKTEELEVQVLVSDHKQHEIQMLEAMFDCAMNEMKDRMQPAGYNQVKALIDREWRQYRRPEIGAEIAAKAKSFDDLAHLVEVAPQGVCMGRYRDRRQTGINGPLYYVEATTCFRHEYRDLAGAVQEAAGHANGRPQDLSQSTAPRVHPVDFIEKHIERVAAATGLEVDRESIAKARAICDELVPADELVQARLNLAEARAHQLQRDLDVARHQLQQAKITRENMEVACTNGQTLIAEICDAVGIRQDDRAMPMVLVGEVRRLKEAQEAAARLTTDDVTTAAQVIIDAAFKGAAKAIGLPEDVDSKNFGEYIAKVREADVTALAAAQQRLSYILKAPDPAGFLVDDPLLGLAPAHMRGWVAGAQTVIKRLRAEAIERKAELPERAGQVVQETGKGGRDAVDAALDTIGRQQRRYARLEGKYRRLQSKRAKAAQHFALTLAEEESRRGQISRMVESLTNNLDYERKLVAEQGRAIKMMAPRLNVPDSALKSADSLAEFLHGPPAPPLAETKTFTLWREGYLAPDGHAVTAEKLGEVEAVDLKEAIENLYVKQIRAGRSLIWLDTTEGEANGVYRDAVAAKGSHHPRILTDEAEARKAYG